MSSIIALSEHGVSSITALSEHQVSPTSALSEYRLPSTTALSEHRVASNTALASNQCTIPFGRKWYNGKRKCKQLPARQVLACNGRNAKRNLIPARERSVFEANRVPAVGRVPLLPTLASRRFRLAGQQLLFPSAVSAVLFVTAAWPNGMVHSLFVIVCTYGLLALSLMFGFSGHPVNR